MLVSIHILFSRNARKVIFSNTGIDIDGRVVNVDTNELVREHREHLFRMVSRVGENGLSIFSEPACGVPSSVFTSCYEPAPAVARIIRRTHYLDYGIIADAEVINAVVSKVEAQEIARMVLDADLERYRIALDQARSRLRSLVEQWKREATESIQLFASGDARIKFIGGVEKPQWLDDVVSAGNTEVLYLWRDLNDAFRAARSRWVGGEG